MTPAEETLLGRQMARAAKVESARMRTHGQGGGAALCAWCKKPLSDGRAYYCGQVCKDKANGRAR